MKITADKAQQRGSSRWRGRGDTTAAAGETLGRPGMAPPHHQWMRSQVCGTDAHERGRSPHVAPNACVTTSTVYGLDNDCRDCIQLPPLRAGCGRRAAGMPPAGPTHGIVQPLTWPRRSCANRRQVTRSGGPHLSERRALIGPSCLDQRNGTLRRRLLDARGGATILVDPYPSVVVPKAGSVTCLFFREEACQDLVEACTTPPPGAHTPPRRDPAG